jgi:endonuclease YncB( thermonuclease family)
MAIASAAMAGGVLHSAAMSIRRRGTSAYRTVILVAVCLQCAVILAAPQDGFSGRVVTVIDGDTIDVLRDGHDVRVRLDGIDAPESGQDFGPQAKQFMTDAAFNKTVVVSGNEIDAYGRLIARVTVDGRDLSLAAVEAGFAWHFVRHSKDASLAAAETRAHAQKRGLWAQPNPVPPWNYRAALGLP